MKKIFALAIALLTLVSCNMDFYSSASMTSAQLKENPSSAIYTTDGIYALFKDALTYLDEESAETSNTYVRHYFQLAESRGDNVTISGHSTDPFLGPYMYEDVDNTKNKYYLWWMAYKIIYAANSNIDSIDPNADKTSSHMLGENYFFRALCHFNMVTLFAQPYQVNNGDTPGVPLRIGMDYKTTTRATVAQVYDAVVEDLKQAINYMDAGAPRGDASYVSAKAARALLGRVYLYMDKDDECIDILENQLIKTVPAVLTSGYDLAKYPTETWSSPETIWCVHLIYPTDLFSAEATIGAMYYKDGLEPNNVGWGEWYWNDELIELFNRYPADKRFSTYFSYEPLAYDPTKDDGKKMICFPTRPAKGEYMITGHVKDLTPDSNGDFSFEWEGKNYKAVKQTDANGYVRYFINDNLTGDATFWGGKTPAYVRANVDETNGLRNDYVRYYNTKFKGQDNQATFSSPVFLRYGEVALNIAEAYAHKGDVTNALKYVNMIRNRAGLTGAADFTAANMAARGYDNVLDVVLDERRMELCFEGHRMFDIYRNKKSLDRRYPGYHNWEVINYDDPRVALLIPKDEINASGIAQNPR